MPSYFRKYSCRWQQAHRLARRLAFCNDWLPVRSLQSLKLSAARTQARGSCFAMRLHSPRKRSEICMARSKGVIELSCHQAVLERIGASSFARISKQEVCSARQQRPSAFAAWHDSTAQVDVAHVGSWTHHSKRPHMQVSRVCMGRIDKSPYLPRNANSFT